MITIENTINSAIVYADSIDPGAEGLIRALCGSPISKNSKIRIMPDVHPGKGCAIGTTMTLTDTVAPGLVGTDIGCGMTGCQVSGKRIELQKLDTLIRDTVPSGRSVRKKLHRFAEQAELDSLLCARHIHIIWNKKKLRTAKPTKREDVESGVDSADLNEERIRFPLELHPVC